MENIQIDVQDLTRGLDNAKKELVIRQTMKEGHGREILSSIERFLCSKNVETRPLEEFLNIAQAKVDRLIKDAKSAQESFNQCVEYFGTYTRFVCHVTSRFLLKVKHHEHKIHRIFSLFLSNSNVHIK